MFAAGAGLALLDAFLRRDPPAAGAPRARLADLMHELRVRPYDLVLVAGGYALRTKTRFAPAIRAAHSGRAGDGVAELTRTETFALTAIAYLQPVTRGEISELAGGEIRNRVFIFGEGLLDRIEVWRVGGQEKELGFGGAPGRQSALRTMADADVTKSRCDPDCA